MKSILLFFSFLTSVNLYSQNYYSFPVGSSIYNISNGNIITAKLSNNKTHLKAYDNTGAIFWEDSLSFQIPVNSVDFKWISQFKNSNTFLICMSKNLTPGGLYSINDTIIYQFTKLNLDTEQFENHYVDTFFTVGISPFPLNDSTTYLFKSDATNGLNPFNIETFSLNQNLDYSFIAASDSIETSPGIRTFYEYDDTIYFHENFNIDFHIMTKYTLDMSKISQNYSSISSSMNWNYAYYTKSINRDSLLVITEGYESGNPNIIWRFDWLNLDLSPISSHEISPPTEEPDNISPYRLKFYNVQIDETNKVIYLLATSYYNNGQKIFTYDYNFNFLCELDVYSGNSDINVLTTINNLVYLQNYNSNEIELFHLDCDNVGLEPIAETKEMFTLFPNPADNKVFIINNSNNIIEVIISTTDGKNLFSINSDDTQISVFLSEFQSGIYLVTVKNGSEIRTKRFVKN